MKTFLTTITPLLLVLWATQIQAQHEFIMTWATTSNNESITIPTHNIYTYDYTVDWGDGTVESNFTGNATHAYATSGTYTVKVTGTFPTMYFQFFTSNNNKLKTVEQWGTNVWQDMQRFFFASDVIQINATDVPDLSQVTDMSYMFHFTTKFNQDISHWDVSNVENMDNMFGLARDFNQDLNSWNVSKVTNMNEMFFEAHEFNQHLGNWNMTAVTNASNMLSSTKMSAQNYDRTLNGWSTQNLQNGVEFSAAWIFDLVSPRRVYYCNAGTARQAIIDNFAWNLKDDGQQCNGAEFETTWETTSANENITIPTNPAFSYDYSIDWGDGTVENNQTGAATHTYINAGTHTVKITGDFPAIYINAGADRLKLKTVEQWGSIAWKSMNNAFRGCASLVCNATDTPDLSQVTNMSFIFQGATNLTGDFSNWDVSQVENFAFGFAATRYNQDISPWEVSNASSLNAMFRNNSFFNQDISGWNTSNVQNFNGIFENATAFNQNLGTWQIGSATNITNMFGGSGMSTFNYDRTLIAWSQQSGIPSNLVLGALGLEYCASQNERQQLIDDFNWDVQGDALVTSCGLTTWNGTAWNNGNPDNSKIVAIEGDYDTYVDGVFTADDLLVKAGYTITIRGNAPVRVEGDLINYGAVLVQDSTSFLQTSTSPNNSGNGHYSVARKGKNFRYEYNYWSSPVQNSTISRVFGASGRNFYAFNAVSQSWTGTVASTVLEAGQGFIGTGISPTPSTAIRVFADSLGFNSGDINQSLSYSGSFQTGENWHLVGNPYPSGLDVNKFLNDNAGNIESAVYLWSSDGNDEGGLSSDYATMNTLGVVNAGGGGILPGSATISSAQGFFVQSKASGSLLFQNSQRINTNNTFLRTTTTEVPKVWLGITADNGAKNELLLAFLEEAEEDKDFYDASKLSGNAFLSFYSFGRERSEEGKFVIQSLPLLTEERIVPLGLALKEAGTISFTLNQFQHIDQMEIYLHDALTGVNIPIQSQTYTVELSEGVHDNRFSLRLIPARITALADEAMTAKARVLGYDQHIHIQFADAQQAKAEISVYTLAGQLLFQSQQSRLEHHIPVQQTGVYLIRIQNQFGLISQKVMLR